MKEVEWNGKQGIRDPDLLKGERCDDVIHIDYVKKKIFCSFQSPPLVNGILHNLSEYRKYERTKLDHIEYCRYKGEKRPVRVDIYLPLAILTLKSKRRKNARAVISKGGR